MDECKPLARGARNTQMRAKRWKKAKNVIGVMSKMGITGLLDEGASNEDSD